MSCLLRFGDNAEMGTIVLGFGKSGISAMKLLLSTGKDVTMYDTRKDIKVPDDILKAKNEYGIEVYAGEEVADRKSVV